MEAEEIATTIAEVMTILNTEVIPEAELSPHAEASELVPGLEMISQKEQDEVVTQVMTFLET